MCVNITDKYCIEKGYSIKKVEMEVVSRINEEHRNIENLTTWERLNDIVYRLKKDYPRARWSAAFLDSVDYKIKHEGLVISHEEVDGKPMYLYVYDAAWRVHFYFTLFVFIDFFLFQIFNVLLKI